jgi:hypothetical protein
MYYLHVRLWAHFWWISILGQIICTICICGTGAVSSDFCNGPKYMHHIHLRLLVHFHWTFGLEQFVCTRCPCVAFASAFPFDVRVRNCMHRLHM